MKTLLFISLMGAISASAFSAEKPPDLSSADFAAFHAQIGKIITLQGRLEDCQGKPVGYYLEGKMAADVFFCIKPVLGEGSYIFPESWQSLLHKQVRVTGKLLFYTYETLGNYFFDPHYNDMSFQREKPHYYMVLQETKIERLE